MIPEQFDPQWLIPLQKNVNKPQEASWFGTPWDGRRWTGDWLTNGYNVGVRTGTDSRLICIDADIKHGIDGIAQVEDKDLPRTLTCKTPSGGRHYWYWSDRAGEVSNAQPHPWFRGTGIKSAVDIRGEGGYAAIPPSEFASGSYEVFKDASIAELPDDVIEALVAPVGSKERPREEFTGEYAEGERNHKLRTAALGVLYSNPTLSLADLLLLVRSINTDICKPPLPYLEVSSLCATAYTYHSNNPDKKDDAKGIPAERLGISTYDARRLDVPPLVSLIGPFTAGGVYIIAGPAGVAKSLWTQHMAHHIAGGTDFQMWKVPTPRPVLVVDGEMNLQLLHGRWADMPDVEGVTHIYEDQFTDDEPFPQMGSPAWQAHFLAPMYTDYFGLMIFDTTSSLLAAGKGMMTIDAEYWQQVARFNSRMKKKGVTIWWVDHTTGYDPKKIAGTFTKLHGIEGALILEDCRGEDKEQAPSFNVTAPKNRVMRKGAPPFRSHWSLGQHGWFQEPYQPIDKKRK